MKSRGAKIVLLVASIIVGVLIAINFNFDGQRTSMELNAREYQDAVEERNKLYTEISSLMDINKQSVDKINEYTYSDKKQEKIFESMKEQLGDYGRLTGLNEVKGPGVVIKINDGIINFSEATQTEVTSKILHDSDMEKLINELRAAGAQAIALNDYRIRPSTAIMCSWAFLEFEDGSSEKAPFNLYAIGDPAILKAYLHEDGSHLRQLMTRGLNIEFEELSEITMPAAKPFEFKYAEEYIEKNEE